MTDTAPGQRTVAGILETALYAEDLEAAEAFFTSVLGLTVLMKEPGRHIFFKCGPQDHGGSMLLVFNPTATEQPGLSAVAVPLHGARGAGHMAFREPHERMDGWKSHLTAQGVAIEQDLTWPNGARSLYFRDPAGNSIEIATPDLWNLPA